MPLDPWVEHRVGLVRFKIRQMVATDPIPTLRPVVRKAVIPSVSTRHPSRAMANFVTSGNRFFSASSSQVLTDLCYELPGTSGVSTRVESSKPEHLIAIHKMRRYLQRLTQMEQKEAETYLADVHDV
jgi:hypothetical protein